MNAPTKAPARERLLTIGSLCRRLQEEFPDISISKIRYLEDQGLLAPRRTRGGYRLFSGEDVERLETILRLQRDEFLPLRVIRQELASPSSAGKERRYARGRITGHDEEFSLRELCQRAEITPELAKELEEFGLLAPRAEDGEKRYPQSDVGVAAVCSKLARFGIDARNLRKIRTSADNAVSLLEQRVAPALRSRNLENRQAGLDELQALAELAQELSQLLFWRDLRRLATA